MHSIHRLSIIVLKFFSNMYMYTDACVMYVHRQTLTQTRIENVSIHSACYSQVLFGETFQLHTCTYIYTYVCMHVCIYTHILLNFLRLQCGRRGQLPLSNASSGNGSPGLLEPMMGKSVQFDSVTPSYCLGRVNRAAREEGRINQ